MAIFLDSFSIKKPVIEKKVCLIHPIEKKYIMKNISSIEYCVIKINIKFIRLDNLFGGDGIWNVIFCQLRLKL